MNREHQSNEAKFLVWALEEYKCECGCGGASIKEIRKYAEQEDWLRDEFCFDTEGYMEETTVSETETVEETADGKRGITMTIRELRKEFKRKLNSLKFLGLDGLVEHCTAEWATFEELYREGTVRRFSNDFLADANHYQRYMREYENLSILQTLDLHSISATKKVTRDMMAMFLDADGWWYGRNSKYEKKDADDKSKKETVESVEVAEETTAPEVEQTAETAEQETELNAEVAQVEAEQTAEQTEENNIPHTVNRDRKSKGDISMNHFESDKYNSPFAVRFRELCKDTATAAKLRQYLGVTSQTISQFKLGTTLPKTENLIRIADFFNVSVDYLLGRTNTASQDVAIQAVCSTTGLSQAAVEKLALWTSADDRRKLWTDYLSYYITSPDFEKALEYINKAHNCYNGDLNEDVIVKLWQVSRKIEVVTESLIELEEIPKTGYFDTS